MKSKLYKVLHPVCGKPMVGHVVDTLNEIHVDRTVVVVGHGAEAVQQYLGDGLEYALQAEQQGTGHAVLQTNQLLAGLEGTTIVICGDTPLVKADTLQIMLEQHREQGSAATILTVEMPNPTGYGRIIRDDAGHVVKIVEQKDCTREEALISEINSGTYIFDNEKLFAALAQVTNDNAQGEYYLTDVLHIMKAGGERIQAYCSNDVKESIGVNDRVLLAEAERYMRERINLSHMVNGVTIIDPEHTYIEKGVRIGSDTVLQPGTILKGDTVIGEDCVIGPETEITNSKIGNGVEIYKSVLLDAEVDDEAHVGPFAYLRPGAKLGKSVKIGDFVEVKNATIGDNSKVSHLSYVGDATIGSDVNFGCGAITVNYDGFNKHKTEIGDGSFIGSNVNLVAPVRIGNGSFVVAGSTITHNVDDNDLAVARVRQETKVGYAEIMRNKLKARSNKK